MTQSARILPARHVPVIERDAGSDLPNDRYTRCHIPLMPFHPEELSQR